MLNQLYIQSLQITFNKTYNERLVRELQARGFSDSRPFNEVLHIGLYISDYTLRSVFLTVQTKMPPQILSEYHVWLRPLSKELYVATPPLTSHIELDPGFTDSLFRPIDEVYSYLNGGTGWYEYPQILDDTRTWG